jgi:tRNA (cmo5U34)-methyltransferase
MKKNYTAAKKIKMPNSSWSFSGNLYKSFDEHINRSIPLYKLTHDLGLQLSDFFLTKNSNFYDIGCSTGSFIFKLSKRHNQKNIKITGIEIEKQMVNFAKKLNSKNNAKILKNDILKVKLDKSDFITSFFTIQFIHPSLRQNIFDKIYKRLRWGGGFLFFEKVRAPDARFQDIITIIYNNFKLKNKFSSEEILIKTNSLKGVLEPFTSRENLLLCKRAGFKDVITVFKYLNFEGFLAIK